MREIKFRVWHKPTNQFVRCHPVWDDKQYRDLGLLSLTSDGQLIFETMYDGFQRLSDGNEVDNFIVQQYTGLKDKNGMEIYEGDILFCENLIDDDGDDELSKLKITWCDVSLCWRGMSKTDDGFSAMDMMLCEVDEEGVVVGNIFEGVDK